MAALDHLPQAPQPTIPDVTGTDIKTDVKTGGVAAGSAAAGEIPAEPPPSYADTIAADHQAATATLFTPEPVDAGHNASRPEEGNIDTSSVGPEHAEAQSAPVEAVRTPAEGTLAVTPSEATRPTTARYEGRARVTLETRLTDDGILSGTGKTSLELMIDGFVDAAVQARTGALPRVQAAVFVAPESSTGTAGLNALVESRVRSRLDEFPEEAVPVPAEHLLARVSIEAIVRPAGDAQVGVVQVRVDGQRASSGLYGPEVYSDPGNPLPAYREDVERARAELAELNPDHAVLAQAREIMNRYHQPPRVFIEQDPPRVHQAHRERHQAATYLVAAELTRPGQLHTGEAADARARSLVDPVGWPRENRILGGAPREDDAVAAFSADSSSGTEPSHRVPLAGRLPDYQTLHAFWERIEADGGQVLSSADESALVRAGFSGERPVFLVDQLDVLMADPGAAPTEMGLATFGEWVAERTLTAPASLLPTELVSQDGAGKGKAVAGDIVEGLTGLAEPVRLDPVVVPNLYGEENLIALVPQGLDRAGPYMWRNSSAHSARFILRASDDDPVGQIEFAPWERMVSDRRPHPLVLTLWPRGNGFLIGEETLTPGETGRRLHESDAFQRFLREPVRRPLVVLGWTEGTESNDIVGEFVSVLDQRIGPVHAIGYQGRFEFWEHGSFVFPPDAVFTETFGVRLDDVRHVTENEVLAFLETADRAEADEVLAAGRAATEAWFEARPGPAPAVVVLSGDDAVVRLGGRSDEIKYPVGGEEIVRLYLAEPGVKAKLTADPEMAVVIVGDFGTGEARPGSVRFDVGKALAREGLFNPVYATTRDTPGDFRLVSGLFADRIKTESIVGPAGNPVAVFVRYEGDGVELARVRAWAARADTAGVRTIRGPDGRRVEAPWQNAVPVLFKPAGNGQVHFLRSDDNRATGDLGLGLRDSRHLREALGRNEDASLTPLLIPLRGAFTELEKFASALAEGGYSRDIFAAKGPVRFAGGQAILTRPGFDHVDAAAPDPTRLVSYPLVDTNSRIHGAFFPRSAADLVNQWRIDARSGSVLSRIYFSEKPGAEDFGGEAHLIPADKPGWRSVTHGNEAGIAAALPTGRPYELGDQVVLEGNAAGAALFGSSVYRAAQPDPDRPHVLFACEGAGAPATIRAIESRWGKGPVIVSTAKAYYGWNGAGIHVMDDGHLIRADAPRASPVPLSDLAAESIPSKMIEHGAAGLPIAVRHLVLRAVRASSWRLANGGDPATIQILVYGSDEAVDTAWARELAAEMRDEADAEAVRLATEYGLPDVSTRSMEIFFDHDDTGLYPPVAEVDFHLAEGSFGAEALRSGLLSSIEEAFSALDPAARGDRGAEAPSGTAPRSVSAARNGAEEGLLSPVRFAPPAPLESMPALRESIPEFTMVGKEPDEVEMTVTVRTDSHQPAFPTPPAVAPESIVSMANFFGEETLIAMLPAAADGSAIKASWAGSGAQSEMVISRKSGRADSVEHETSPWADTIAYQDPGPLYLTLTSADGGFQVDGHTLTAADTVHTLLDNEAFHRFRQDPVRRALVVLVRDTSNEPHSVSVKDFLGALQNEIGPVRTFDYQGPFEFGRRGLLEFPRDAVFGESFGAALGDVRHGADGAVLAFLGTGGPRQGTEALEAAAEVGAGWARAVPGGRVASVLSLPGDDSTVGVGWARGDTEFRIGGGEAARLYLQQPGAREALAGDPERPLIVVGDFTDAGTKPGSVPFEVSSALAREGLFNPVYATSTLSSPGDRVFHLVSGMFADRVRIESLPDAEGNPAAVFVRYAGDEAKLAEVREWVRQPGAHGVLRVIGPDGARFEPPWRGSAVPIFVKPAAGNEVRLQRSDGAPAQGALGPALRDSQALRAALGRTGDGSGAPHEERAPLVLAVEGTVRDLAGFARELAQGGYFRETYAPRGPVELRPDGGLTITEVAFDRADSVEPDPAQVVSYPLRNADSGTYGVFFPANAWDLTTQWRFDASADSVRSRIYFSNRPDPIVTGDWYLAPGGDPGWRTVVHGSEGGVHMALATGRRRILGDQVLLRNSQASAALFASAVYRAARPDTSKSYRLMACEIALARELVEAVKADWGEGAVVVPTAVAYFGNGRRTHIASNGHLVRVDRHGQVPVRLAHLAAERVDSVTIRLRQGMREFPDLRLAAEFAARPTAWRLANGGEPATIEIRIRGAKPENGGAWADALQDVARTAFDSEAGRLAREFELPDATGRLVTTVEFDGGDVGVPKAEIEVRLPEGDFGLTALKSLKEKAVVRAFAALAPHVPADPAPGPPPIPVEGRLLANAETRPNLLDLSTDPAVSQILRDRWGSSSHFAERLLARPVWNEHGEADYAESPAPWAETLTDGSTPVRFLVVDAVGSPLDAAWRVAGNEQFRTLMSGAVRPRLAVLAVTGSGPAPPRFAEQFTHFLAELTGPMQSYRFTGRLDLIEAHGVLVADPGDFRMADHFSIEDLQPYENGTVFGLRAPGDDALVRTALAVARAPEQADAIVLFAAGPATAHIRAGLAEHPQEIELTGAEAGRLLLEKPDSRLRELLGEGRRVMLLSDAGAEWDSHGGKGFDLVDALLAENFTNDVYAHTGPVPAPGEPLELVGVSHWRHGEVKKEVLTDATGRPAALFVRYPGDAERLREVREWLAGSDAAQSRFFEGQDGHREAMPGRPVPVFLGARSAEEIGAIRDINAGTPAVLSYADVSRVLRDDPDLRTLLGFQGNGYADPAKERWLMPVSLEHPLAGLKAFHEGLASGGYSRWTSTPEGQVTLDADGVLGVRSGRFEAWEPVKPGTDNVFSYTSENLDSGAQGQFFPSRDFDIVKQYSAAVHQHPASARFYLSEITGTDGLPSWRTFLTPSATGTPWYTDLHAVDGDELLVAMKTGYPHRRGDVVTLSEPDTMARVLYGNATFDTAKPAEVVLLSCAVAEGRPETGSLAKILDETRFPGTHRPSALIAPTALTGRAFEVVPAVVDGGHFVRLGMEDTAPLPVADLVRAGIDPVPVPEAADGDHWAEVREFGVKLARALVWRSVKGVLKAPVRLWIDGYGRDEHETGSRIAETAQAMEHEFLAEGDRLRRLYGFEPVDRRFLDVTAVHHLEDTTFPKGAPRSVLTVNLPDVELGGTALAKFERRLAELHAAGEAPSSLRELEEMERVFAPLARKGDIPAGVDSKFS
ncbi:hypothetical protein DMC64_36990 [Amycolatopsis sp. WAC 04197]|nr:hypothetical protein DMC64_36990 [Amycolatopsis sp. WAC 04197]